MLLNKMGLLNNLFPKEDIAKEISKNVEKRIKIWNEYLETYLKKEKLAKELLKSPNYKQIIKDIETLIPKELMDMEKEEKNEKELLKDFKRLTSVKWGNQVFDLKEIIQQERDVQSIYSILEKLSELLKAEINIIKVINKNPEKIGDYLDYLYKMIVSQEFNLNTLFRHRLVRVEFKETQELVHKIIRGEKILHEIETDEEKFSREIFKEMAKDESKSKYRKLGEDIFSELAEMAGAPLSKSEDILEGIERMEGFMANDKIIYNIIRKLRPKYDDAKIKIVITVFRKAYNLDHFSDLESEFAT